MKKTSASAIALLVGAGLAGAAFADAHMGSVKVGVLGGVTGPIAQMAPPMISAAQLAFDQVNAQGGVLGGRQIEAVVGDSGCNPQLATDAASKAVNVSEVSAIVGPHCSGAYLAAANTASIPAGLAQISPSATSPEVSGLDDNDVAFRTVPSDAYQGQALARAVLDRGVESIAVTYLNNDYGSGLANAFKAEYEAQGGTLAAFNGHEEGKASYRSELAELSRSGADTLAVFDYGDGSGLTIMRQALENGFFENFVGGDGMKSDAVIEALGAENLGGFIASSPVGEEGLGLELFNAAFIEAGGDPDAIFVTTSYDAAFLVALAIEQAGSDDRAAIAAALRDVATAPGAAIYPGEWEAAAAAIASGEGVDYKGAAGDHEFDENGDVPGAYALFSVGANSYEKIADLD